MSDRSVTAAPGRSAAVGPRPDTVAKPSARSTSSVTNRATSRWNGNSAVGRRCRDIYLSFLKQAGSPAEPAAQAAILALSEQVVLAEAARAACLADGGLTKISLEMAIRAENLANRTLKRLKLDKPVSSKRAAPSLEDIRAKYAKPATGETAK